MEEITKAKIVKCEDEKYIMVPIRDYVDLQREAAAERAKRELIENAVSCNIPHPYIREMLYGISEHEPKVTKNMFPIGMDTWTEGSDK